MAASTKKISAQSKTARASMPSTGPAKGSPYAQAAADIPRIVPCGSGAFAYVRDPGSGHTMHLQTGSDAFRSVVTEMAANGMGERLLAEFDELDSARPGDGWAAIKQRLVDDGAFAQS